MLGSQSDVVNGQRFALPTSAQFAPASYGPQTSGVPNVSPTLPPMIGSSSAVTAGNSHVNGYGTADNNGLVTRIAAEHPHSLVVSPVWWAVIALVFGILILRGTAWRKTVLESGTERVSVAGASESASEKT